MVLRTSATPTLEVEFNSLARQWKDECAFLSSTSAMVNNPNYRAIIALGPPVVPLLLRELEKEPVHWFEALEAITGENPVARDDWGRVPAMAAAWLAWGRTRKLL